MAEQESATNRPASVPVTDGVWAYGSRLNQGLISGEGVVE